MRYHIHRSRGPWIVAPEGDTWRKEKYFIWTFTLQILIQLVCRISKEIFLFAFSFTTPKQNSKHGQNNLNAAYRIIFRVCLRVEIIYEKDFFPMWKYWKLYGFWSMLSEPHFKRTRGNWNKCIYFNQSSFTRIEEYAMYFNKDLTLLSI